jgi:hypothetical protein
MKNIISLSLIFFGTINQWVAAQKDEKQKLNRYYIKTELLASAARLFDLPANHFDVQLGYRINQPLMVVGVYGRTKYFQHEEIPSVLRQKVTRITTLEGLALHRSNIGLRYFPFVHRSSEFRMLFIEPAYHYMHYFGSTEDKITDDSLKVMELDYSQKIVLQRSGAQISLGIAKIDISNEELVDDNKKHHIVFSPEAYITLRSWNTKVLDENLMIRANTKNIPVTNYTENNQMQFEFRIKLGIGWR